jgi:[ribosomal protein S18]-alanine N-acetyltransferase
VKDAAEGAQIRRMAAADVDQAVALARGLPEAPRWPRSAYLNALDPEATPRRIALVAVGPAPEAILGFAVASLLSPEAELETIAVARDWQRHGLGRRLVAALTNELEAAGARDILLEVRASNQAARAFYRTLGFGQTGQRRGYYTDPVEDAVLMRFELA